jgi:hypothetical protein
MGNTSSNTNKNTNTNINTSNDVLNDTKSNATILETNKWTNENKENLIKLLENSKIDEIKIKFPNLDLNNFIYYGLPFECYIYSVKTFSNALKLGFNINGKTLYHLVGIFAAMMKAGNVPVRDVRTILDVIEYALINYDNYDIINDGAHILSDILVHYEVIHSTKDVQEKIKPYKKYYFDLINLLLSYKIDPNTIDSYKSPLDIAIDNKHIDSDIVEILLKNGGRLNNVGIAFMIMLYSDNSEKLDLLLEYNIDPNTVFNYYYTRLASNRANKQNINKILKKLNDDNINKYAFYLIKTDNVIMLNNLKNICSKFDLIYYEDKSLLDYAKECNSVDCIRFLQK